MYQVKNISNRYYVSAAIKIRPNEVTKVNKSTFEYLKKTFEKFNIFEFISEEPKEEKDTQQKVSKRKPRKTKTEK